MSKCDLCNTYQNKHYFGNYNTYINGTFCYYHKKHGIVTGNQFLKSWNQLMLKTKREMIKQIKNDFMFGHSDGGFLSITKCTCGKTFGHYDRIFDFENDKYWQCPSCKRKFVFEQSVAVYEWNDEK